MRSHRVGGVGGAAPAGSNGLIIDISGVVGLQTGQIDGTDGVVEIGVWNADEGDVVQHSLGIPALMDDDAVSAYGVLDLGASADGAAQMNIDGINTVRMDKESLAEGQLAKQHQLTHRCSERQSGSIRVRSRSHRTRRRSCQFSEKDQPGRGTDLVWHRIHW